MKKFFITLMLLTIGWLAYGSDFVVTHRTPTGEIMSRVIDEEETDGFSTAAMRPKAPVFKEGEAPERITLHIKFEYPENLVPDYVSYSQVGYGYYAPYNGEDEVDLVIGKDAFGHNIITASFVSTDPLANPDDAYLVFLRVPEFIDGMELIVDANTICNSYDFEFLDPEGNPFKIRHQLYDPTTGETVIDGDGNIDGLDGEISVYDANGFEIWWNMFELINRSYTDGRPEKINDRIQTIHINPLPDDLAVIAGAMGMNGNDEIWMMKTVPGNVSGHYNNDLKQYAEQEFKICNTPYMFGEEMLINYSLFTAFNGYLGSEMSIYLDRKIDDEVSTNIIMPTLNWQLQN